MSHLPVFDGRVRLLKPPPPPSDEKSAARERIVSRLLEEPIPIGTTGALRLGLLLLLIPLPSTTTDTTEANLLLRVVRSFRVIAIVETKEILYLSLSSHTLKCVRACEKV